MNIQSVIVMLVVGLAVLTPFWTVIMVRRRYGVEAFSRPWWWLCMRIGCNGIMGAGAALGVFGMWAEMQGIKDPSWGGVLSWVLVGAISFIGGITLLLRKIPTETLYKESFLLAFLWFAAIVVILAMRLANVQLSAHIMNGLLLTGFGAVFTRLLKHWI